MIGGYAACGATSCNTPCNMLWKGCETDGHGVSWCRCWLISHVSWFWGSSSLATCTAFDLVDPLAFESTWPFPWRSPWWRAWRQWKRPPRWKLEWWRRRQWARLLEESRQRPWSSGAAKRRLQQVSNRQTCWRTSVTRLWPRSSMLPARKPTRTSPLGPPQWQRPGRSWASKASALWMVRQRRARLSMPRPRPSMLPERLRDVERNRQFQLARGSSRSRELALTFSVDKLSSACTACLAEPSPASSIRVWGLCAGKNPEIEHSKSVRFLCVSFAWFVFNFTYNFVIPAARSAVKSPRWLSKEILPVQTRWNIKVCIVFF